MVDIGIIEDSPPGHLGYPKPSTHRAKLFWESEDGGDSTYIYVDVIPSFEETLPSTITEFPLANKATISDHIIHHPGLIKLEIVQTNTPFQYADDFSDDGSSIEPELSALPIKQAKTAFEPRGLLYLSLAASGLIGDAVDGVGSLLGFESGTAPTIAQTYKPPYTIDRINQLRIQLNEARLNARVMTLQWLGEQWSDMLIQQIVYRRKADNQGGYFSVNLKKFQTVSTATADLPTPAEARLATGVNGGNRPSIEASPAKKKESSQTANRSILKSIFG